MVFPVSSPPRSNAVVEIDRNGTVLSVSRGGASFRELAGVEYYSGILIPGLADMMCGPDESGHRLLATGVRVAGKVGWSQKMDPGTTGVTWRNRYGGTVGYTIYKSMDHFRQYFREGEVSGVCHFSAPQGELQVLAGYGRTGLLELMLALHDGPHRYTLPELLTMATLNGALATGYGGEAGTLSPGMRPGLNIIEGVDTVKMRLLPVSRLRRLY